MFQIQTQTHVAVLVFIFAVFDGCVFVARVLFSYRITPQSTTGISPAEMLLGRKLHSTLDPLHPDLQQKVRDKQSKQKQYHDNKWQVRSFQVGDAVLTGNFSYGPKWIPGSLPR